MDLSTSLGKFGKFDDKLFLETMQLAKEKIFKTGKFSGIIPYGNLSWKDLSLSDFKVYFFSLFKAFIPKSKIKTLDELEEFIQTKSAWVSQVTLYS